jgi:flagellar basal-body rod protein FlgF
MQTGRPLDVAMDQNDWLAVQASDGSEAYTKAGALHTDSNGQLLTADNLLVLGDSGPISLPPYSSINIGPDGTISLVPAGSQPNTLAAVGRLKIVQASRDQLERGTDGLMRAKPGVTPDAASGTVLIPGSLESSNVNLAGTMVQMIQLARQFELQTKVLQTADSNAAQAASLVSMNG